MLEDFLPFIALDLTRWEVYGLFFLLGSFAVATLSDLKHMSAQREFMDVWWAVGFILLGVQVWASDLQPEAPLIVKWVLVGLFGLLSHQLVGLWLRLATADVAAAVAAAMLLPPGLVLAFFLLLKLLSWPAAKILARGKNAYPFMPVITLATVLILALGSLAGFAEI